MGPLCYGEGLQVGLEYCGAVQAPKTFEHGAKNLDHVHKEKELTLEEKNKKMKEAEPDTRQKHFNAPSGGTSKALGKKYS